MIFVTVGTHEQPFNRLIQEVDRLIETGQIKEIVMMQIGYSTYIPKHSKFVRFMSFNEIEKAIEESTVVITHGGPASFLKVLSKGKKPVVVPRQTRYDEHVNDHQLEFAQQLVDKKFNIDVVVDISELNEKIQLVGKNKMEYTSNTEYFVSSLINITKNLLDKKNKSNIKG